MGRWRLQTSALTLPLSRLVSHSSPGLTRPSSLQAAGWAPPLLPSVQILDSLLEVPECAGKRVLEGGAAPILCHLGQKNWFSRLLISWEDRGLMELNHGSRVHKENIDTCFKAFTFSSCLISKGSEVAKLGFI